MISAKPESIQSPRRIAMISVHTSPLATLGGKDAGGMNVYVRDLAIEIGRAGVSVDVFTRRTDPARPHVQQLAGNVRIINLDVGPVAPVEKNKLAELVPEFTRACVLFGLRDGIQYDVVHAHYWLSGLVAEQLRTYWEAPFVLMFHTTADMKNAVLGGDHQETDIRRESEHALIELADSIIAANPDERADLVWRLGANEDKVCTIPPGVDLTLFRPLDYHESRRELGWSVKERIVIYVGRIDPIKGIDTLIDTMPIVQEPQLQYVLIGGDLDDDGRPIGPLKDVADRVAALGMSRRCRFLGAQPQDMLPLYYSAADVVAVPSRYESFGLVAVEAMATGTPVIASSVGGLTFTVDHERNGLLIPYGDVRALAQAIDRLLDDDDFREAMSFNAINDAQRFSWDAVAQQVLHVYQRLAEGYRVNLCCDEEIYAASA
jgi:D-inositol-3-phosphate glycosyltransferase